MGPNGQNPAQRGPIPKTDGAASDRRNPPKFGRVCVAADTKGWSLASSLVRPARCRLPKHKPVAHISPPLRRHPRTGDLGARDAGHRRRDAGKRGGSRGRGPALLSPRRSQSEDAAAGAVVLSTAATPPAVRSCAVSAGGELSCSCFQTASRLRRPCLQIMVDSDDEYYFKNFIDTSSKRSPTTIFSRMLRCSSTSTLSRRFPCTGGPCRAAPPWTAKENAATTSSTETTSNRRQFSCRHCFASFRMTRPLFRRIMDGVKIYDDYFRAKVDALGKVGLSSYQKCTAAIRMLAYGVDFVDEYTRMSESTAPESMYRFCRAVIGSFGEQYLRQPNAEDTARLLSINAARGFPRMLGSIDCMHWEWKNCPFGWRGIHSRGSSHTHIRNTLGLLPAFFIWGSSAPGRDAMDNGERKENPPPKRGSIIKAIITDLTGGGGDSKKSPGTTTSPGCDGGKDGNSNGGGSYY
ncbi:hypothetical protein QYE76_068816 [Lolium multiflorum]|uniref:Uncharacterized protein n=1 Tax=Lolium multiflorum TaxID=4521 RepID=A0AAD8SGI6_LOLMU|nr:hypothetical protein QYE76_068816 [Lolium multiflorum]